MPNGRIKPFIVWGKALSGFRGGVSLIRTLYAPAPHPTLEQTLFDGVTFCNPLGLAAGFDKNIGLLSLIRATGFGYEEVGSISSLPAPGNPKPRLFRLPRDKALLNRMGLNNHGVKELLPKIRQFPPDWPVGISVVKTPDPTLMGEAGLADFAGVIRAIHGRGAYVSINISCPNTEEGKTFEDPQALDTLLARLRQAEAEGIEETALKPRPWCLKISPDLEQVQLDELFEVACRYQIAGWVASNTTSRRSGLRTPAPKLGQLGKGGISGEPLQHLSTRILGRLYQLAREKGQYELVLIGVGGIHDADSAWEKIIHGASLLQLYSGLVYEGPGLLKAIQAGLLDRLHQHGMTRLREAVGAAYR